MEITARTEQMKNKTEYCVDYLNACNQHLYSFRDVLRTSVPTSRFALCGHDFLHFYLIGIWYFFFEVYYYIPVTFSII